MVPGKVAGMLRILEKGPAPLAIAPIPEAPGAGKYTLGLAKNAPHPNAARLFIDSFLSVEGLIAQNKALLDYMIVPEVAKVAYTNQYLDKLGIEQVVLPLEFLTHENLRKSVEFWEKIIGVKYR